MANEAELLEVAGALYEAAVEPEAWPRALSRVDDALDAHWSLVGVFRRDGTPQFLTQDASGDGEHFALFGDRYAQPDTNPSIPRLLASRPGTIIVREQVQTDREWQHEPLYRDIYRPRDLYHGLGAFAFSNDSHVGIFGVNRAKGTSAFSPADLAVVRTMLLPHVGRALRVFLNLKASDAQRRAHEQAWDALACGVLLLDGNGRVLWTNHSGAAVLARSDGLSIRNGALVAANTDENVALQSLVRAALATQRGRGLQPGGSLGVSRPSQSRPFTLSIDPIHMPQSFVRRPAAIVFIADPDREPEVAPERLRRLFGLTAREAAVAAEIVRGYELHAVAERLGMSLHTARTLLRFVFLKTDTHRQSELVRLILRSPEGLR